MRETYPLSKESLTVLTDRVGAIAAEMDVNESYLYQILSNAAADPFAKFQRLFAACVRAGAPVCHWTNRLNEVQARYEKSTPLQTQVECLTEKIARDADTTAKLVDALKDGQIDDREADQIYAAIMLERQSLDLLEAHLFGKQAVLRVAK